jgi:hypothetical protein
MGFAVLALALGLTAACGAKAKGPGVASAHGGGGGNASASPTASVDPEEQSRLFAQCMREHGVDVPDPDPNQHGGAVRVQSSAGTNIDAAMKACEKYLPTGKMATPDPQTLEKLRQFAQCMRDHGIDMPDPDAQSGGLKIKKSGGPDAFRPDDPAFEAAQKACEDKLPNKPQTQTQTGPGK